MGGNVGERILPDSRGGGNVGHQIRTGGGPPGEPELVPIRMDVASTIAR